MASRSPSGSAGPPETGLDGNARRPLLVQALDRLGRSRRLLVAFQALVATVLVAGLVLFVDWRSLVREVATVDPLLVFGAALCLVAALVVGAFDLWVLLGAFAPISYAATLRVYVVAWCSFLALPGSAGDIVQILLLRDLEVPYRLGTGVYLTDKLITLAMNLTVVIVGGWLLLRTQVRAGFLALLLLAGAGAGLALYVLARRSDHRWARWVVDLLGSAVDFARRHPGRVAANAAGSGVKLLLAASAALLLLRGLGAEISLSEVVVVHPAALLVAYLPVAFNGIGTVELAAVGLYGALGVASDDTVAAYLLLRILVLAVALAGLAAVAVNRRRRPSEGP